jgi:Caspase domain
MRSISLGTAFRSVAVAAALLVPSLASAQNFMLRSSDGGEVRALVIGIDAYRHVRPLKGAVADAQDLETALRNMGTRDITVLTDAQADRTSVLLAIDRLVARTRPSDLVFLSIAGHGTQEPERIKGSQPDGMENVFLLPGFEPSATGSQQRILGREFNHFIRQFELRGAKVLFVADTCHGGGMTRDIDPRSEEMSFRQVPTYRLTEDTLRPVTTAADDYLNELDLDRTAFLAAVDRKTKSPEVRIPGIATLRGALSYAVARAIEGNADADKDGKITLKELFSNVRQVVYQLSNQRQNIVTMTAPSRDLNVDVAYQMTRGISVIEVADAPSPAGPPAKMTVTAAPTAPAAAPPPPAGRQAPAQAAAPATRTERPVRIASLDGKGAHFSGIAPREAAFEIVQPIDNPDLVWDPVSRDVLAWGDVVAYRVDKSDLPSVIDRAAAVRDLKQIATKAPQVIKVGPDDGLHRNESMVQIELSNVSGRSLVLFNIAGDGTVQMLYPIGSDPTSIQSADFRFPVRVREPFGADQIVAVTSTKRMTELEQALLQSNRQRRAAQMIKMVQRLAPPDARIGSAGLYTAP